MFPEEVLKLIIESIFPHTRTLLSLSCNFVSTRWLFLEYAIPQKDGVGSNTQIAVPGGDEVKEEAVTIRKKLKDMTSDEREEYQYEADVRNVTRLLGW